MIYGTAWKEDRTEALAMQAFESGFRAFDTANQKKHYREDYLGSALRQIFDSGTPRESLWLQSKYTYARGQDHRLPYNPDSPFAEQVLSSFESSLKHLHTDYLDSYLIHGPYSGQAITQPDLEVWSVMQDLKTHGRCKKIGISNVSIQHLIQLTKVSKPDAVQNRCYAIRGWDREVREFCIKNEIEYQGFSLLTANPHFVEGPTVIQIARQLNTTSEQVVFSFARRIGIRCLTGTSNPIHMKQDLIDFELNSDLLKNLIQSSG